MTTTSLTLWIFLISQTATIITNVDACASVAYTPPVLLTPEDVVDNGIFGGEPLVGPDAPANPEANFIAPNGGGTDRIPGTRTCVPANERIRGGIGHDPKPANRRNRISGDSASANAKNQADSGAGNDRTDIGSNPRLNNGNPNGESDGKNERDRGDFGTGNDIGVVRDRGDRTDHSIRSDRVRADRLPICRPGVGDILITTTEEPIISTPTTGSTLESTTRRRRKTTTTSTSTSTTSTTTSPKPVFPLVTSAEDGEEQERTTPRRRRTKSTTEPSTTEESTTAPVPAVVLIDGDLNPRRKFVGGGGVAVVDGGDAPGDVGQPPAALPPGFGAGGAGAFVEQPPFPPAGNGGNFGGNGGNFGGDFGGNSAGLNPPPVINNGGGFPGSFNGVPIFRASPPFNKVPEPNQSNNFGGSNGFGGGGAGLAPPPPPVGGGGGGYGGGGGGGGYG